MASFTPNRDILSNYDLFSEDTDMGEVLESKARMTAIGKTLKGADAQRMIDRLKSDSRTSDILVRHRMIFLMARLCKKNLMAPEDTKLTGHVVTESLDTFARGGFANIYRGRLNGMDVAAKVPQISHRSSKEKTSALFYKEVGVWSALQHKNLVEFLGIAEGIRAVSNGAVRTTTTLGVPILISRWMENGDLEDFLKVNPRVNRLSILSDVAAGLEYLHTYGVVHGDLKPKNILINSRGEACLADFGLTSVMLETGIELSISLFAGGSAQWAAPELFELSTVAKPGDIYAYGMTAWHIFTGRRPFPVGTEAHVMRAVLDNQRPDKPENKEHLGFSEAIWTLIQMCWAHDPLHRPSAESLVKAIADEAEQWSSTVQNDNGQDDTETVEAGHHSDDDDVEVLWPSDE